MPTECCWVLNGSDKKRWHEYEWGMENELHTKLQVLEKNNYHPLKKLNGLFSATNFDEGETDKLFISEFIIKDKKCAIEIIFFT